MRAVLRAWVVCLWTSFARLADDTGADVVKLARQQLNNVQPSLEVEVTRTGDFSFLETEGTAQLAREVVSDAYAQIARASIAAEKAATWALPCPELKDLRFYMLNLDRRPDRLKRMAGLLKEEQPWMCDKTCRVPGPDGKSFGNVLNQNLVDPGIWSNAVERTEAHEKTLGVHMTKGTVGLSLGHALIWDKIRQQKEPWAVILEDDLAYFNPQYGEALCNIAKEQFVDGAPTFDVVKLTNCKKKHCEAAAKMSMVQNTGNEFCLGAYAMTPQSAKKALDSMFPIEGPQVDSWLYRAFPGAHTASPCAVTQIPSEYGDSDAQILYDIESPSASFMEAAETECKIPICEGSFAMDDFVRAGELARTASAWRQKLCLGTAAVLCMVCLFSYSYWRLQSTLQSKPDPGADPKEAADPR